jgi:hypothetical protein
MPPTKSALKPDKSTVRPASAMSYNKEKKTELKICHPIENTNIEKLQQELMMERRKNHEINQKVLDRIKTIFKEDCTTVKVQNIAVDNVNGVF